MKILLKYMTLPFSVLCMMSFSLSEDNSQLYVMALNKHLLSIENKITSKNERKKFAYKTVFILNECDAELPGKLNNHAIQILADSSNDFISGNVGLHVIKLNPIKVDKGNIVIILSDYMATKSNGVVKFSYIGGVRYTFNYYSKNQSYKIVRTQIISF